MQADRNIAFAIVRLLKNKPGEWQTQEGSPFTTVVVHTSGVWITLYYGAFGPRVHVSSNDGASKMSRRDARMIERAFRSWWIDRDERLRQSLWRKIVGASPEELRRAS